MDIIFGGKLESALISHIDEIVYPQRNTTTHEYYLSLNRKTDRSFFDRCGTFIALADHVLMPEVDWNIADYGEQNAILSAENLGIQTTQIGGREWDDDTTAFSKLLVESGFLSETSHRYISHLDLSGLSLSDQKELELKRRDIEQGTARHYLCRLFLQLRAAAESGSFLILSEYDLDLLREIGDQISKTGLPIPFELPDLSGKLLSSANFLSGLMNFAPHDALSLVAVRNDNLVRKYAADIRSHIGEACSDDGQRKLLRAMKAAYQNDEMDERVDNAFEIASWAVKPLHYVPGADAILTAAEDIKDLGLKWLRRDRKNSEWYLIAARMTEVNIKEYLARNDNRIGPEE